MSAVIPAKGPLERQGVASPNASGHETAYFPTGVCGRPALKVKRPRLCRGSDCGESSSNRRMEVPLARESCGRCFPAWSLGLTHACWLTGVCGATAVAAVTRAGEAGHGAFWLWHGGVANSAVHASLRSPVALAGRCTGTSANMATAQTASFRHGVPGLAATMMDRGTVSGELCTCRRVWGGRAGALCRARRPAVSRWIVSLLRGLTGASVTRPAVVAKRTDNGRSTPCRSGVAGVAPVSCFKPVVVLCWLAPGTAAHWAIGMIGVSAHPAAVRATRPVSAKFLS